MPRLSAVGDVRNTFGWLVVVPRKADGRCQSSAGTWLLRLPGRDLKRRLDGGRSRSVDRRRSRRRGRAGGGGGSDDVSGPGPGVARLEHGLVGARARAVDQRVLGAAAVVPGGDGAPHEELLEGLAELTRHAAVDGEVDGVADDDEEVGEEDEHVGYAVVEELGADARDDVERRDDGQRDLHQQEDRHHHDQHQRRAVGVAQLPALALAVLLEREKQSTAEEKRRPRRSTVVTTSSGDLPGRAFAS